ncbi:MAG TPA: hypothetical protein IAC94_05590 [Candidatus Coprenecus avistercoris]|uniref:DUF5683 domain-containing protein n=1 Tax=Candidatus Coprenecus avistercoris TaxID=2840730 RepID=A0A9D1J6K4_9BACT|nr:hypothetical protein [Candidatus Coprenecus avistercoris]
MKKTFFLILLLLPAVAAWGQYVRGGNRPAWTEGFFQEEQNSYIEVVSAFGYDEESARNKAAEVAISRRNLATGAEMKVRVSGGNITVDGDGSLIVKSRIVDEYIEYMPGQGYRVYLLVQTAKNPTLDFESVNVTDRYPFSMRAFVPGMAQIHKGSTGKGIAFISAEVVMIGGVVAFECMRSYYDGKVSTTHNSDAVKAYIDNARVMSGLRNGFIAGAVAVYVWNVIDGIVAKGERHIMVGEASCRISPYVVPDSGGIMLTLNF